MITPKNNLHINRMLLFLTGAALLLRIPAIFVRFFDEDEFQHLHAARNIYHGMLPYRDFFEHHTPYFHFFLSTFYRFWADQISLLFVCRTVMLLFEGIIFYLTYYFAKLQFGNRIACFAVFFLSYTAIFQEKIIEIRPDSLGLIFWLSALIAFTLGMQCEGVDGTKPRKYFALAGFLSVNAFLTTQKVSFGIIGLLLLLVVVLFDTERWPAFRVRLSLLGVFLLGFGIPFIAVCSYFYSHQGLDDFIYSNFLMGLHWKQSFTPYKSLGELFYRYSFLCVFSLWGLGEMGYRIIVIDLLSTKDNVKSPASVGNAGCPPAGEAGRFNIEKEKVNKEKKLNLYWPHFFSTLSLLAGLFLIHIPYKQYYLFFLPLWAIYAGLAFEILIRYLPLGELRKGPFTQKYFFMILFLIILILCFYAIKQAKFNTLILNFYFPVIVLMVILMGWSFFANQREYFILAMIAGIAFLPTVYLIKDFMKPTNRNQLAEIRYILENTSPKESVFDVWTGTGVFRDQAYFYGFLHKGLQMMLTPKELSQDILQILENKQPKIVTYDKNAKELPKAVQSYILAHYMPTGLGYLYLRK